MFHLTAAFAEDALSSSGSQLRQHLFPIERDIVERLHKLGITAFREEYRDSRWTVEVKRALLELGQREGFLTWPRANESRFEYEWLFDIVWLEAKHDAQNPEGFDWRKTRALRLACECEWGMTESAVLEDFLKLTVVIADLRLFIYTNALINSEFGKIHPVELCKRICPLSRGFRYLAVGFPSSGKGKFQVDTWVA